MRWTLLLPFAATLTFAAGKVSTNAQCGRAYNALPSDMTCQSSRWGDCCSQYGYCGKTKDYCGTGCQSSFGTCNSVVTTARVSTSSSRSDTSTQTASSTAPSSTAVNNKITTNARCGNSYGASPAGMICYGGKYGDCCSQYSYCGSSSAYCGTGCQPGFGKCNAVSSNSIASSSISSSSSSSSSSSTSSASSSSSTSISISSTNEVTISTSSSESSFSDSSTATLISTSSSVSTEIPVTLISSTPTTSSSTTTPSPIVEEFCGIEGAHVVNLQFTSVKPFTTVADCLASCRAEITCESFVKYPSQCVLARLPITSTNIRPSLGSPLIYYNRNCEVDSPSTAALPTTMATSTMSTPTSTSTSSTSTSTVCVPPAPTVSCVARPPCQRFTTPLSNACAANNAQCNDNYFVRCANVPAAGSQYLPPLANVRSADACSQKCDAVNNCSAFAFRDTICVLYTSINGFVSEGTTATFIRLCPNTCSVAPVRRNRGSDGVNSVSMEMWNKGAY